MSDEPSSPPASLSPENPWGRVDGPAPELPVRCGPSATTWFGLVLFSVFVPITAGVALLAPLIEEDLGRAWALRAGYGAISLGLGALVVWLLRNRMTWLEVDAEGITEERRVRPRVTRIRWDEVTSFDVRIVQAQQTIGGADVRAEGKPAIDVQHDARVFGAVKHLLRERVLPRLVHEAMARIDAGETLVFPRFSMFRSREKRLRDPRHRLELRRSGIRRVSRKPVDMPWARIDRFELGVDDRLRLEAGLDRIDVGFLYDDALILLALTTELLLREGRTAAAVGPARTRGWRRMQRDHRIVAVMMFGGLAALLGILLSPVLLTEWRVRQPTRLHALQLERGHRTTGIALGSDAKTLWNRVHFAFVLDGGIHEGRDWLCDVLPELGDPVAVVLPPRHPEVAQLVESCLFDVGRRRRKMLETIGPLLAMLAAGSTLAIAGYRKQGRELRRMRAAEAGRDAPGGATLTP